MLCLQIRSTLYFVFEVSLLQKPWPLEDIKLSSWEVKADVADIQ